MSFMFFEPALSRVTDNNPFRILSYLICHAQELSGDQYSVLKQAKVLCLPADLILYELLAYVILFQGGVLDVLGLY